MTLSNPREKRVVRLEKVGVPHCKIRPVRLDHSPLLILYVGMERFVNQEHVPVGTYPAAKREIAIHVLNVSVWRGRSAKPESI